ncbi:25297_t:CDS:2, partial [Gigaspora rosea]
ELQGLFHPILGAYRHYYRIVSSVCFEQPVSAALPPPGPIVGRKVFHKWKLAWQSEMQIGWSAGGTGWSSSELPIVQPVVHQ